MAQMKKFIGYFKSGYLQAISKFRKKITIQIVKRNCGQIDCDNEDITQGHVCYVYSLLVFCLGAGLDCLNLIKAVFRL